MAQESDREQAIEKVAKLLRNNPFSVEIVVVKKPKGIKIIYEVTQEQMDRAMLGKKNKTHETAR
jgi:intracellular sulfur oxidation DsrE/DsrF family protein